MKKRMWLQILIVGAILFVASEQALIVTGNPSYLPTILMLGSFLISVVFVAYFYEHVMHREISLPLLTNCFVVGGVIGAVTGAVLLHSAWNIVNSLGTTSRFSFIIFGNLIIAGISLFLLFYRYHKAKKALGQTTST